MTDDEPRSNGLYEQAAPHIITAVQAYAAGDQRRVANALRELTALGPTSMYGTLAAFAHLATYAVPRGTEPGGTWCPALLIGTPPRQISIDQHPAAAFAFRFLAATLNRDEEYRYAIYNAFVDRGDDPARDDDEAGREGAEALVLMVQLAARGLRAREAKAARTHQHPNARRRGADRRHGRH